MKRILCVLIFMGLGLVSLPAETQAQELIVLPAITTGGDNSDIDLAIEDDGSLYLTYVTDNSSLYLLRSDEACQTWEPSYTTYDLHPPIDPALFSSPCGTLLGYLDSADRVVTEFRDTSGRSHAIWWDDATVGIVSLAGTEGGCTPAGFRYFAALGIEKKETSYKKIGLYSTATNAFGWDEIPSPFASVHYHAAEPSLLFSSGRLHLLCQQWRETDPWKGIYYSRSEIGNFDSWETVIPISIPERDSRNPRLAGNGDHLIALWEVEHTPFDVDIHYRTSDDGGETWSGVRVFADRSADEEIIDIYVDRTGYVHVLYQVNGIPHYRRAYIGDWAFNTPTAIPDPPSGVSWVQGRPARLRGAIVSNRSGEPIMVLRAADAELYPVLPLAVVGYTLCKSTESLDFGTSEVKRSFEVWNCCGGGTLPFTVGDNRPWITVSPVSGTSSGERQSIEVRIDRSQLEPGHYTGTVTITTHLPNGTVEDYFVTVEADVGCAPSPPPTGVKASKGDHPDRVTVTWNPVSGSLRYDVYRAESEYGDYYKVKETTLASYDDYNVTQGRTYWYKIAGCNDCGCSDFSRPTSGYVAKHAVSIPDIPIGPSTGEIDQNLTFSSGGATCTLDHSVQYAFDWGDGTSSDWSASTSASHAYTEEGTYYIRARARCATDPSVVSDWSPTKTIKIGMIPGTPNNLAASDGSYSTKVRLTWDAGSGADRYEIYRSDRQTTGFEKIAETADTKFDDSPITVGQRYWYRVKACNDIGCSDFSSADSGYATEPTILSFVCDREIVRVPEGGTAEFQVKLSAQPAETIKATVKRTSGDSDITVTDGTTLTFTPEDWDTYQSVSLAAAEDDDKLNGSATILIQRTEGEPIPNKEIEAIEVDNSPDYQTQEWVWFDPGWSLISLGIDPIDPAPADVFDEITSDLELQHWDPVSETWQSTVNGTLTELSPLEGYWLWLPEGEWVAVEGAPLSGTVRLQLGPAGGQMIGVPYEVAWGIASGGSITVEHVIEREDVLEVKSLIGAVAAGWIYDTIWEWDNRQQAWIQHSITRGFTLEPWKGYWIHAFLDDLVLRFSPQPATEAAIVATSAIKIEDPPIPTGSPRDAGGVTVVCTPNPMTGDSGVTFRVAGICSCRVGGIRVFVYDNSGTLIWEGETDASELRWEGTSSDGQTLANGIYFYRAEVKVDQNWVRTPLSKIAILR